MKTTLITKWPNGMDRDGVILATLSDCREMQYEEPFESKPDSNQRHLHEIKARNAFAEITKIKSIYKI